MTQIDVQHVVKTSGKKFNSKKKYQSIDVKAASQRPTCHVLISWGRKKYQARAHLPKASQ